MVPHQRDHYEPIARGVRRCDAHRARASHGMKRTGGQCRPGVIKQSQGPCRKAEQLAATRFIEL